MTSIWQRLDVEDKVVDVLTSVRPASSPRLSGHPFLTTYQLAILLDARYPEVRQELGNVPVGSAHIGSHTSLAQYLAERLAAETRRHNAAYRIEGATLSRTNLSELSFKQRGAAEIRDTNAEAGFDISLFRLRE